MKRWRDIRAGLIAFAIAIGLVDGCPIPPRDQTLEWQRGFVEPIRSVQTRLLAPVAPIKRRLRIAQRWALYQAPSTQRFRLWVEGQDAAGQWHLLFRAGDAMHAEDAALIDYTRPRGAWDPTRVPPAQYQLFASWMTQRVLDHHPEYIAARVRYENVQLSPHGVTALGTFAYPHVRQRPAVEPRVVEPRAVEPNAPTSESDR